MSKFHKTISNHFQVGTVYLVKGHCYDPLIRRRNDDTGITELKSVIVSNPIQMTYIGFEKGHLKFNQMIEKSLPETIVIHASYIKNGRVTIKNNSETFTPDGWI